jgi:hypothetical protein
MYYNPHTNLELARARHDDMLREAARHRLAARVAGERPSVLERIRRLAGRRVAKRPVEIPAH